MALLYKDEEITKENPKLQLYTYADGGALSDVESATFKIFDITTQAKRALYYKATITPTELNTLQEFPATPGDSYTVDVTNSAYNEALPGHKIDTGRYFANWATPSDASPGSYIISWKFRFATDTAGEFRSSDQEFVITADVLGTSNPTLLSDVREFMRDYELKNELIEGFESTDREIMNATRLMVARYNMLPPQSVTFEVDNFPENLKYVAVMGVVGLLLKSISLQQLRNQLTYTDGGVHVGLSDKHQLYKVTGMELLAEFDDMAGKDKIIKNLESVWGSVNSPYHGYYTFVST